MRGIQTLRWAMEQQRHRRRLCCRYPLSGHARNPCSYEEHSANGPPIPYMLFPPSFDERLIQELPLEPAVGLGPRTAN